MIRCGSSAVKVVLDCNRELFSFKIVASCVPVKASGLPELQKTAVISAVLYFCFVRLNRRAAKDILSSVLALKGAGIFVYDLNSPLNFT